MPIKPENKALYPADWNEIRARILDRAGHRCEWCGVPNGVWRRADGDVWTRDPMRADSWAMVDGFKVSRIVLTIAHVHDPDPRNCADHNLAALCQRCHNRHDAPMRRANAYETRRQGRAAGDLFKEDA